MQNGTAIDISNYTGRLSGAQLDHIQQTYDLVIVRLSAEDKGGQRAIAAQQVEALAGRGIPWQGYLWAYWGESPYDLWKLSKEMLPAGWPGYYSRQIWIDLEDKPKQPQLAVDWLNAYARILETEDFAPGCYTGRWWIDQNPGVFAGGGLSTSPDYRCGGRATSLRPIASRRTSSRGGPSRCISIAAWTGATSSAATT